MQAEHARVHAEQQSHQELLRGERQAQKPRFCGTAGTKVNAMFGWLSQVPVLSHLFNANARVAVRSSPLLRSYLPSICAPQFCLKVHGISRGLCQVSVSPATKAASNLLIFCIWRAEQVGRCCGISSLTKARRKASMERTRSVDSMFNKRHASMMRTITVDSFFKSSNPTYTPLLEDPASPIGEALSPTRASNPKAHERIPVDGWEQAKTTVFFPISPWKEKWDTIVLFLILYSAVSVPFRVCFSSEAEGVLWDLELAMTFVFMADVVFNFNTAYREEAVFIINRRLIAINYLRGWFWIDAPSSTPVNCGFRTCQSAQFDSLVLSLCRLFFRWSSSIFSSRPRTSRCFVSCACSACCACCVC